MRIISGKLGGRQIRTGDYDARPAMGKTREALFSILESRGIVWEDLLALDLFAGTGSIGFEAVSRGASHVDFVDSSRDLCNMLRINAENLGISGICRFFCEDARKFLSRRPASQYGLVFIDPPYRKNLLADALKSIVGNNFLLSGAFVCAEVEKDAQFDVPTELLWETSRNFGQTTLEIWKME